MKATMKMLDEMEHNRLADLTQFLQSFSVWHREVNKWLQSTARVLHSHTVTTSPGRMRVNDLVRAESKCQEMLHYHNRNYLLTPLVQFWKKWAQQHSWLRKLLQKRLVLTTRNRRRFFLLCLYEHATARHLYRRQVSKAVAYGNIVHKKFAFACFVLHHRQVSQHLHAFMLVLLLSGTYYHHHGGCWVGWCCLKALVFFKSSM